VEIAAAVVLVVEIAAAAVLAAVGNGRL